MTYVTESMKITLEIKITEKKIQSGHVWTFVSMVLLLYRFKFTDFVLWNA